MVMLRAAVAVSPLVSITLTLNVHVPVTSLEVPFIENVLRKAGRIERDTIEQEKLFKEIGYVAV